MIYLPTTDTLEAYWRERNLGSLLAAAEGRSEGSADEAIGPKKHDLARIHWLITRLGSMKVLEFGVGYSTVFIVDALLQNRARVARTTVSYTLRKPEMFKCVSVDTSPHWINVAYARLSDEQKAQVEIHQSDVSIGLFGGRICHFYDRLPDICPDFIYIDGPDPAAVQGDIAGLTFQSPERTVMAADLLMMEPILLPGTSVLIDGRANNARFLERNFQREVEIQKDPEGDVTFMRFVEAPLGQRNVFTEHRYGTD